MTRRPTLILFVIALALAGYYAVFERSDNSSGDDTAYLMAFDPDAVETVRVQHAADTLQFERVDTHWEMTRPVSDIADAAAVMRLLAALADCAVERNLGAAEDVSPYGLDAPITIRLKLRAGDTRTVLVGDYNVDRSFVYAMHDGGTDVLLVPTTVRRYASGAPEDYRFKRIATFDISVVDSFRIEIGARLELRGEPMAWHRDAGGWHTIVRGDTIRGNTDAVEGVLRRVRALRAIGFPPELEQLDPEQPASIRIYRDYPAPPQEIRVASRPPTFFLRIEPGHRIVEVDSSVVEIFSFTVDDLRDKDLLRFDPSEVTRIELESGRTIAAIIRNGNVWSHPNPALGDIDPGRVRAALAAAAALSFSRIPDEKVRTRTVDAPTFRLAVIGDGGTIIDELTARFAAADTVAVVSSRSLNRRAEIRVADLERLEERFERLHSTGAQ